MGCCAGSRRRCSTPWSSCRTLKGEQTACLRALQMLKELNATGRRKLLEDSPTDFLPQRHKPIVINHGEIVAAAVQLDLLRANHFP